MAIDEEEDHKILIYIAQKKAYNKVKDIVLWVQMAKHFKSKRTAKSLKERFLNKLLPRVDEYFPKLAFSRNICTRYERLAADEVPGWGQKATGGKKSTPFVNSAAKISVPSDNEQNTDKVAKGGKKQTGSPSKKASPKKVDVPGTPPPDLDDGDDAQDPLPPPSAAVTKPLSQADPFRRKRDLLSTDDQDEFVDCMDIQDEVRNKKDHKKTPEVAKNALPARPRTALVRPLPSTDSHDNQLISDQESIIDKADALSKPPAAHLRDETYEKEEDHKILIYIAQKLAYDKVKGVVLWEEMAKHFKGDRTANSLKERFLAYILPRVDEICLELAFTSDLREKFERIAAAVVPGWTKKVPTGEKRKVTVDSDMGPKKKKSHYFNRNSDDSSSEDDQEENMTEKEKEKVKKDFSKARAIRMPYSPSEDSKIVEYVFITEHPTAIVPVSGNYYWKQAEQYFLRNRKLDRTWQSLKERFKKVIIPTLFRLTIALNTPVHRRIATDCYQRFYSQEWKSMIANYDKARRPKKITD